MRVTNVTVWATLHGSAHKEVEAEEIVDATETVVLDAVERSASNATNLDTLRVSAKRIRTFAIVATVLDTSLKTVNRLVPMVMLVRLECRVYFELSAADLYYIYYIPMSCLQWIFSMRETLHYDT